MKILYAPFAARSPSLGGQPSPKDYPWAKELGEALGKDHEVIQVGGGEDPQVASDVRRNLGFADLRKLINESDTAVCVDSYLGHYYWYVNRRAIVIFGISDPLIFGHESNLNLLKDRKYLRANQWDWYYTSDYCTEAFVSPEVVIESLHGL